MKHIFIGYFLFFFGSFVFAQEDEFTEFYDCENALEICGTTNIDYTNFGETGNPDFDRTNSSSGCLDLLFDHENKVELEVQSFWIKVKVASSGTFGFNIGIKDPNTGELLYDVENIIAEDYDYAVYAANSTCGNLGEPIRCSTRELFATDTQDDILTGVGDSDTGDFSDYTDGYTPWINANAGDEYYIFVHTNYLLLTGFNIEFTGSAQLECDEGSCQNPNFWDINADTHPDENTIAFELDYGESLSVDASPLVVNNVQADYLWSTGETTPIVSLTEPGTYTVLLTVSGCEQTFTIIITQKDISPPTNPNSSIKEICDGESAILSVDPAPDGYTVRWFSEETGGTPLTNTMANDYQFEATTPGDYWAEYYFNDGNGSVGSSSREKVIFESITVDNPTTNYTEPVKLCASTGEAIITATVSAGHEVVWYDDGSIDDGDTPDYIGSDRTVTAAGTYFAFSRDTTHGCISIATPIEVNQIDVESPESSAIFETCSGNSIEISVNAPSNNDLEVEWLDENDDVTYTTLDREVSEPGTYKVRFKDVVNDCYSETTSVTVGILTTEAPTLETANTLSICSGAVTFSIENPGSDFDIEWTNTANNTVVSNSISFEVNQIGTFEVRIKEKTNSCWSETVEVNTTKTIPDSPTITSNTTQSTCFDAVEFTATQTDNLPIWWYSDAGLTTREYIGNTFSPTIAGTYYAVVQSAEGCFSESTSITLSEETISAPTVDADKMILCPGGDVQFVTSTTETGVKIFLHSESDLSDEGTEVGTFTLSETGDYYLVAKSDNGKCTSSITPISVVDGTVDRPTSSSTNYDICTGDEALITLTNVPSSAKVNWYKKDTNNNYVLLTSDVDNNDTFSSGDDGDFAANYELDGCASSFFEFQIDVENVTEPTLSNSNTYVICPGGEQVIYLSSVPSGYTVNWYKDGVQTDDTDNDTQTTVNESGDYTVQFVSDGCASDEIDFTITSSTTPDTPQISDITVCDENSNGIFTITNNTDSHTVLWYRDAAGTIPLPNDTSDSDPNTYPITGVKTIYAQFQNTAGCLSAISSASSSIETISNPTINESNVGQCSNEDITLSVNIPDATYTVEWYKDSVTGTALTASTVSGVSTLTISDDLTNNTTYVVQFVSQNGCISATDQVIVSALQTEKPTANKEEYTYCSEATRPNLNVDSPTNTNETIHWYADAALTNKISAWDGLTSVTPTTDGSFYAVTVNTLYNCTSEALELSVNPDIIATPTNVSDINTTVCNVNKTTLEVDAADSGYIIEWYADAARTIFKGSGTTLDVPLSDVSDSGTEFFAFTKNSTLSCYSDNIKFTVTKSTITIPTPTDTFVACSPSGTTDISVNPVTGADIFWFSNNTDQDIASALNSIASETFEDAIVNTNYYARAFKDNCWSEPVLVTVNPSSVTQTPILNNDDVQICSGDNFTFEVNNVPANHSLEWIDSNGDLVTDDADGSDNKYTATVAGNYSVRFVNTLGCSSVTTSFSLKIPTVIDPDISDSSEQVCIGGTYTWTIGNYTELNTAGYTVIWKDGTVETTNTATYEVSADKTITATIISDLGCEVKVVTLSTIGVSIDTPTAIEENVTLCKDGSETIGFDNTNDSNLELQWFANDTDTSTPTNTDDYTRTITESGDYFARFYDKVKFCYSEASKITVTENSVDSPKLASGILSNQTICSRSTATFEIETPATGINIKWYTVESDDSLTEITTEINASGTEFSTSTEANYAVRLIDGNCESEILPLTVTVLDIPTPTYSGNETYCEGSDLAIKVTNFPTSGYTIQWYDDNGTELTAFAGQTTFTDNTYNGDLEVRFVHNSIVDDTSNSCFESETIEIIQNSQPTAPTLSASSTDICANPNITITSSSSNTTWYSDAELTINEGTGTTYTPTEAGTYFAVITDPISGCVSEASSITITSNSTTPKPVSAGPFHLCGSTVEISVAPLVGATIVWYEKDQSNQFVGLSNTNTDPYSIDVSSAGTYYARNEQTGCNSEFVKVEVLEPTIPVVVDNPLSCYGTTKTITLEDVTPGYEYIWEDSTGTEVQSGTSNNYTSATNQNYTVYMVRENDTSCKSSGLTISPNFDTEITVPAQTEFFQCDTEVVTLTTTDPGTGFEVNWYSDAALTTQVATNTLSYSTNQSGTYYLQVVNTSTGCASQNTQQIKLTNSKVTVAPTPTTAEFYICEGSTTPVDLTITDLGDSDFEAIWFENENSTTELGTGNSYSTTTPGTYYVSYKHIASKCIGERVTVILENIDLPQPSLNNKNAEVCSGDNFTFEVTNSSTDYAIEWLDSNGDTVTDDTDGSDNKYTATIAGNYAVRYVQEGCESTIETFSLSNTDVEEPTVLNSTNLNLCSGVELPIYLDKVPNGFEVIWRNGTTIDTNDVDNNNAYTVSAIGNYSVQFKDANGCLSDIVPFTINAATEASDPTITSPTVCSGDTTGYHTISNVGTNKVHWFTDAAGTINAPTDTSDTDDSTYPIADHPIIYAQLESIDGCLSGIVKAERAIENVTAPVIKEGDTLYQCNDTSFTLSVDLPDNTYTAKWYKNDISSTAIDGTTDGLTNSISVTENLLEITNYYVIFESSLGCISASDNIVVTPINLIKPTAANKDIQVCKGDDLVINIDDTTENGVTLKWYDATMNHIAAFDNLNTITATSTGTYFVTKIHTSSGCESEALEISIDEDTPSTPTAISSQDISECIYNSAQFEVDAPASGYQINWYLASDLTNVLFTGNTFEVDPAIYNSGKHDFVAITQNTDLGCNSTALPFSATFTTIEAPTSDGDFYACNATTPTTISAQNAGTGTVYWFANATTTDTTLALGSGNTYASASLNNSYFARIVNNGCISEPLEVKVNESPNSVKPSLNSLEASICSTDSFTFIVTNLPASYTLIWMDSTGNPVTDDTLTTDNLYTPSTSGTYSVVTVNSNGCSSAPTNFELLIPTPIVPVLSEDEITLCDGEEAVFSLENFDDLNDNNYTVNWLDASNNIVSTSGVFKTTNAGNYSIQVYSDLGCKLTPIPFEFITETIAEPTLDALSKEFCSGDTETFVVTNWDSSLEVVVTDASGAEIPSVVTDDTITLTSAGNYFVVLKNSNECSSTSVKINLKNTTPTTPTATQLVYEKCEESTNLDISVNTPLSNHKIEWYADANRSGTILGSGETLSVSSAGSYFAFQVYDTENCYSEPLELLVNNRSVTDPIIDSSFEKCTGDSKTISINPPTGYSVFWFESGNATALNTTSINSYTFNDAGDYEVQYTSGDNCLSSKVAFTINDQTATKPILNSESETICNGESYTFEVTNAASEDIIKWYNASDVLIATNTNTYTTSNDGSYYVVIENGIGCESSKTDFNLVIEQVIEPTLSRTLIPICEGETISVTPENIPTGYTVNWLDNNGTLIQTSNTLDVNTNFTGKVQFESTIGCQSTSLDFEVFVDIVTPPSLVYQSTYICEGGQTDLVVNSPPANHQVNWYDSANNLIGTGSSITVSNTGSYFVTHSKISTSCESELVEISVTNPVLALPITESNIALCEITSQTLTAEFDPLISAVDQGDYVFEWFTSNSAIAVETAPTYEVFEFGTYRVRLVHRPSGCATDFVEVNLVQEGFEVTPEMTASATTILEGESTTISINTGDTYLWNNGDTTSSITVSPTETTTYSATVTSSTGCVEQLNITIIVESWDVSINGESGICDISNGQILEGIAPSKASVEWNDGSNTRNTNVVGPGVYTFTASIGSVSKSATIEVTISDLEVTNDTNQGCIETQNLMVIGGAAPIVYSVDGINYYSFDEINKLQEGDYTLYVKDDNNCVKQVDYKVSDLKIDRILSPNNDGVNDNWSPKGLSVCTDATFSIIDRFGRVLFTGGVNDSWNGYYLGKKMPENDYWYIIEFNDGVTPPMKGHFLLKKD